VEEAARGDQGVTVLCLVDQIIGGACPGACPWIHAEVVSPEDVFWMLCSEWIINVL
jgi:hypothetical protein